jgi:hypothetical protein
MKRFQQLISKYQKTIQVLLAISFFILLPIACKKEAVKEPTFCDQHPDQCAPISEAKDFFLFKMGSWWVYEEETSKVRDSVYVTEYSNTETYDFDARYTSALTGYTYHFFPFGHTYAGGVADCDPVKPINTRCISILRSKYKSGNFVAEDVCFFVYYNKNYSSSTENSAFIDNKITINDVYNSYNLNSNIFGKTIKLSELHTSIEHNQPTNHYYSKGVGLIRKELLDSNQVWNLVNYHIEP